MKYAVEPITESCGSNSDMAAILNVSIGFKRAIVKMISGLTLVFIKNPIKIMSKKASIKSHIKNAIAVPTSCVFAMLEIKKDIPMKAKHIQNIIPVYSKNMSQGMDDPLIAPQIIVITTDKKTGKNTATILPKAFP